MTREEIIDNQEMVKGMPDREKVIEKLKELLALSRYNDSVGWNPDNDTETLADAIALLKAQEPDEDWISRKRLRDEIRYYIEEAGYGDEANKVLGWCLEFIDNQEAVKWE